MGPSFLLSVQGTLRAKGRGGKVRRGSLVNSTGERASGSKGYVNGPVSGKHFTMKGMIWKADIKSCVSLHYRPGGNLVGIWVDGGSLTWKHSYMLRFSGSIMALKGGKSGTRPDVSVKILTEFNQVSRLGSKSM